MKLFVVLSLLSLFQFTTSTKKESTHLPQLGQLTKALVFSSTFTSWASFTAGSSSRNTTFKCMQTTKVQSLKKLTSMRTATSLARRICSHQEIQTDSRPKRHKNLNPNDLPSHLLLTIMFQTKNNQNVKIQTKFTKAIPLVSKIHWSNQYLKETLSIQIGKLTSMNHNKTQISQK